MKTAGASLTVLKWPAEHGLPAQSMGTEHFHKQHAETLENKIVSGYASLSRFS
jgi:hypothetical protein